MPYPAAIDLTGSDDEVVITSTVPAAARPAQGGQGGTAAILAAALARAGNTTFSGVRQQPRTTNAAQSQALLAARRMYNPNGNGGQSTGPGHASALGNMMMHSSMYWSPLTLSVASPSTFKVTCESALPPAALRQIKATAGAQRNAESGAWELPLSAHVSFFMAMQRDRIICERIPQRVLSSLAVASAVDNDLSGENDRMDEDGYAKGDDDDDENAISDIPRKIWDALAPFQRQGVSWIVKRNGRALLADEPGLGKTIQAIGAASAYYHEWPLLVVSPSSARYHWEAEIRQWLPDDGDYIPEDGILVITSEKQAAISHVDRAKVIVTSYDLVHREQVRKALTHVAPKVVICDECHYLKNSKAQRTKNLLPVIKNARRAILLSGTPALSRPVEIFSQLHALDPDQWADLAEFNRRYCAGTKKGKQAENTNTANTAANTTNAENKDDKEGYSAASHLEELHTLLRATLMLRRSKATILKKLPPKRRVQRFVPIDDVEVRAELRAELEEFRSRASELAELSRGHARRKKRRRPVEGADEDFVVDENETAEEAMERRKQMAAEKKALLMQLFRRSGAAKLPAIERHVSKLLNAQGAGKLLIFAHHRAVLDMLSSKCLAETPHIRIDGNTPAKERMSRVNKFQNDATIRVALLGITAAGIALTLTAASHVIFTELYWTPASLIQAEDRAHRIGQTSEVVVEYLLAHDCVDDILWPCVQHKMNMLGELFENKTNIQMETVDDDNDRAKAADKALCDAPDDDDDDHSQLLELEELEQLHKEDTEAVKAADADKAYADEDEEVEMATGKTRGGRGRSASPHCFEGDRANSPMIFNDQRRAANSRSHGGTPTNLPPAHKPQPSAALVRPQPSHAQVPQPSPHFDDSAIASFFGNDNFNVDSGLDF